MNFENQESGDRLLLPHEYQEKMLMLQQFLQLVTPSGAVSDETEAQRLYAMLQTGEPIKLSYVDKIIGQLGDALNRSSHYH